VALFSEPEDLHSNIPGPPDQNLRSKGMNPLRADGGLTALALVSMCFVQDATGMYVRGSSMCRRFHLAGRSQPADYGRSGI
jgi:hypothetical protein